MSITQEAQELVNGERQKDYGDMKESFIRIAGMWESYLGVHIEYLDVAKMMILLKVSRARHSNHRDSFVDIAGYVECIDRLINE